MRAERIEGICATNRHISGQYFLFRIGRASGTRTGRAMKRAPGECPASGCRDEDEGFILAEARQFEVVFGPPFPLVFPRTGRRFVALKTMAVFPRESLMESCRDVHCRLASPVPDGGLADRDPIGFERPTDQRPAPVTDGHQLPRRPGGPGDHGSRAADEAGASSYPAFGENPERVSKALT